MTILEALERFGTRDNREVFDVEIWLHGVDAWPEAMVAAVDLAGFLDDAKTDDDLNEGVQHFKALRSSEIVSCDQWTRETEAVMRAVINAAQEGGRVARLSQYLSS